MRREAGVCVGWHKSWGFIRPTTGRPDLFVSFRDIEGDGFRALTDGQRVSFERGVGPDARPRALAVRGDDAEKGD